MKKRSLLLKALAIANAILITATFVGCPARQDPNIVTIAPPPFVPQPIATQLPNFPAPIAPPPPPFVTIAPYGGNLQQLLPSDQTPATPSQDARNDKPGP
jgi:hypothetical protein